MSALLSRITRGVNVLCTGMDAAAGLAAFCALVVMLAAISMQIFFRLYLDALPWTEELARYMLVWVTFLGATLAYRRGLHITVNFVVDFLPGPVARYLRLAAILASLLFFGVIMFYAVRFMQFQSAQLTPSLRIPIYLVYAVIPFSLGVMFMHSLHALLVEIIPAAASDSSGPARPQEPEKISVGQDN
ncbi:MAG: TRAP transporter small permease [Desulfonatronovibrionaceae bacterium]